MKKIKEKHFIVEYLVSESDDEDKEIKKLIREVEEEKDIDLSKFKKEKPAKQSNELLYFGWCVPFYFAYRGVGVMLVVDDDLKITEERNNVYSNR